MPKEEEPLTPEEKLLKVIRGSEKTPAEPAPSGTSSTTTAPAKAVASKPASAAGAKEPSKTALKLAAPSEASTPVGRSGGLVKPTQTPPVTGGPGALPGLVGGASAPVAGRKRAPTAFGVNTVNKLLAAAVVIILCLAAFEIWSSVMAMQLPVPPAPLSEKSLQEGDVDVPNLAALLQTIANPLVLKGQEEFSVQQAPTNTPTVALSETRDNLIWLGTSPGRGGDEYILSDRKDNRLFLVKAGQKFLFRGKELTLSQVGADSLVFSDGKDQVTVRSRTSPVAAGDKTDRGKR